MKTIKKFVKRILKTRIILDSYRKMGNWNLDRPLPAYDTTLDRDQLARDYILRRAGSNMKFLDVGGADTKLHYLLGCFDHQHIDQEKYKENETLFDSKYKYHNLEWKKGEDICADTMPYADDTFDVIYSSNTFEHLAKPWKAGENIVKMLKPGGIAVIITEFSARYHQSPEDYFRFTHIGLPSLFPDCTTLKTGYDITCRRYNLQGRGTAKDIVPVDEFGAWREGWQVVSVLQKL